MSDPVFDLIVHLRGGVPEKCDFCDQLYNETRRPIPEEAGLWACTVCWEKWEKGQKPNETC